MPHANSGGVSNRSIDPDFIAPPGVPVEVALSQREDSETTQPVDEPKKESAPKKSAGAAKK